MDNGVYLANSLCFVLLPIAHISCLMIEDQEMITIGKGALLERVLLCAPSIGRA